MATRVMREEKEMKRFAWMLLTAALIASASAALGEVWYVQTQAGSALNVRAEPSMEADIIGKIRHGNAVQVLQMLEDNSWAHVSFGLLDGYCSTDYMLPGDSEMPYALEYDESQFAFEDAGIIKTYRWKNAEADKPPCFLSLSYVFGYDVEATLEGLMLHDGEPGERVDVQIGGAVFPGYTYSYDADGVPATLKYACVPAIEGGCMVVELGYYEGAPIADTLEGMLASMQIFVDGAQSAQPEMAQCDRCGG